VGRILFQTDAQKARFDKLQLDLIYARRVAKDIADPLLKARDQARENLRGAVAEIGLPDGARQFVVRDHGVYFASPGQEWDTEKQEFVDPPKKPAKVASGD